MTNSSEENARSCVLSQTGASANDVLLRLGELEIGKTRGATGTFSVKAMEGDDAVQDIARRAFNMHFSANSIFSGIDPGLGRIEDELQSMCIDIMNGDADARANITSGGSESIYCALHAMREWARSAHPNIVKPEVVVPWSAHAAFSRGAHYLGLKLIRTSLDDTYAADIAAFEAAIGPNTIGIAASAPDWCFGRFDPIADIAAIAQARDLWFHVDACVGGFLAPFVRKAGYEVPESDFAVPGVKSISADLHKYGYAPKPCSVVLWRSEAEERHHYVMADDWPAGPYLTQSMLGSRPAAATIAAWAVMNFLGEEGYVRIAQAIMKTKQAIVDGIAEIDGLATLPSDLSLMNVESKEFAITDVLGGMTDKGWVLFGNHDPPLIHLTVDPAPAELVERLLTNFRDVCGDLASGWRPHSTGHAYVPEFSRNAPQWMQRALSLVGSSAS